MMDLRKRTGSSHLIWVCWLTFWLTWPAAASAQKDYAVTTTPTWVEPMGLPAQDDHNNSETPGGVRHLLFDRQIRIDANGTHNFTRHAIQVSSPAGVEEMSQISIDFDPTYQDLSIHHIEVRRAGKRLNKLTPANASLLQRERELESLIYDGTTTFHTILEDVRPGDIIDYSYSIRGLNPVFEGRHYSTHALQWSVPVERSRVRVLVGNNRQIDALQLRGTLQPVRRRSGELIEVTWQQQKVPALKTESSLPDWHDAYPQLQLSEAKFWQAVREWGDKLYRFAGEPPGVQEIAASIRRRHADDGERTMAVLRFMQEQIRYLGIEINAGSHAPSSPAEVLKRRYGDCKDKTVLMIALLEQLGIEAYPALVDTKLRHTIANWLPSPLAFNHVLVQVRLNGGSYWLDPTRSPQGGTLETVYQPNYGRALVIDGRSTRLTAMPQPLPDDYRKSVLEQFDFSAGTDRPGRLTVTTRHLDLDADRMRADLEDQGRQAIQEHYLEYYSRRFPGIRVSRDLLVQDDRNANRLIITEHYVLPPVWNTDDKPGYRTFYFRPNEILDRLKVSHPNKRLMPLGIGRPITLEQVTELALPGNWEIEPEEQTVEDTHFRFRKAARFSNGLLRVSYEFRNLKDHVQPDQFNTYRGHLERADALADFGLQEFVDTSAPRPTAAESGNSPSPTQTEATTHTDEPFAVNWMMVMIAVGMFGLSAYLAYRLNGWDPEPPALKADNDGSVHGIGGWLLIPTLGLILSPVILIIGIRELFFAFDLAQWTALTLPTSPDYIAGLAPLLIFEISVNIMNLVFGLLVLWLLFNKRSSTPRLYIALALFRIACISIDTVWASLIPELQEQGVPVISPESVRDLISMLIWIAYIQVSKRVAATFRRRRSK